MGSMSYLIQHLIKLIIWFTVVLPIHFLEHTSLLIELLMRLPLDRYSKPVIWGNELP